MSCCNASQRKKPLMATQSVTKFIQENLMKYIYIYKELSSNICTRVSQMDTYIAISYTGNVC